MIYIPDSGATLLITRLVNHYGNMVVSLAGLVSSLSLSSSTQPPLSHVRSKLIGGNEPRLAICAGEKLSTRDTDGMPKVFWSDGSGFGAIDPGAMPLTGINRGKSDSFWIDAQGNAFFGDRHYDFGLTMRLAQIWDRLATIHRGAAVDRHI